MALITRRAGPGELADVPGLETIELEPLDADAVRELLTPASEAAATLPAAVREQLVERAQGNPLLLGELTAAAQAGGARRRAARLGRGADERAHGHPAARRPPPPSRGVGARQRGRSSISSARSPSATRRRSPRRSGASRTSSCPCGPAPSRFSHALLHDAAYSALPFRRRRELHARAGAMIRRRGGEELEEILAIHFGAAQWWPETWHYGRLAGERALKRAAPREAAGFLESATAAARWLKGVDPAELAEATARLGEAAKLAGLLRPGAQGLREGAQAGRGRPGRRGRAVPARGPPARGRGERLAGASLLHARPRGPRRARGRARRPRSAPA